MRIKEEDYIKHYGVLGMRWGRRKKPDQSNNSSKKEKSKSVEDRNEEILKKFPQAAVLNRKALKDKKDLDDEDALSEDDIRERNRKIRNVAIGVGLGLAVVAGGYLYVRNKKAVDSAAANFFNKFGKKPLSDLPLNPGELSPREIQAYEKLGFNIKTPKEANKLNFMAAWVDHDTHRYDAITDEAYNALDDKPIVLKAGHIMERLTMNPTEIIRDGAYVSVDDDDKNRYRAFLPALRYANMKRQIGFLAQPIKHYSITLEAIEEIKSPSAKERVDIFADLIKNDVAFRKALLANSSVDPLDFAKKNYNNLATEHLMNRNSLAGKIYKAEVIKRGYNALVDDNDAGRLARMPMILLKSTSVNQKNKGAASLLTRDIIKSAGNSIIPMGKESFDNTSHVVKNTDNARMFAKFLMQSMDRTANIDAKLEYNL